VEQMFSASGTFSCFKCSHIHAIAPLFSGLEVYGTLRYKDNAHAKKSKGEEGPHPPSCVCRVCEEAREQQEVDRLLAEQPKIDRKRAAIEIGLMARQDIPFHLWDREYRDFDDLFRAALVGKRGSTEYRERKAMEEEERQQRLYESDPVVRYNQAVVVQWQ
jgi:hypothetical protein